ncbi:MAG: DUF2256 domain-containing protein [Candidatus Pacebacteria bacterium]|nr:DUF2256 domain-containing protein [Candidatus Paceibacterota bacterium]
MKRNLPTQLKQYRETKKCLSYDREFQNRKSWKSRGQWELVKYCSERCRKSTKK